MQKQSIRNAFVTHEHPEPRKTYERFTKLTSLLAFGYSQVVFLASRHQHSNPSITHNEHTKQTVQQYSIYIFATLRCRIIQLLQSIGSNRFLAAALVPGAVKSPSASSSYVSPMPSMSSSSAYCITCREQGEYRHCQESIMPTQSPILGLM